MAEQFTLTMPAGYRLAEITPGEDWAVVSIDAAGNAVDRVGTVTVYTGWNGTRPAEYVARARSILIDECATLDDAVRALMLDQCGINL